MSLYEDCLSVARNTEESPHPETDADKKPGLMLAEYSHSALREMFSSTFYYISDIHLEHRILHAFPNGCSDKQALEFIDDIVSSLLTDDIALFDHDSLILFGGDTAASFYMAASFYSSFVRTWDKKNKAYFLSRKNIVLALMKDLKPIKKQLSTWEKEHPWVRYAKRDLLEYSDKRVSKKIKQLIIKQRELEKALNNAAGFSPDHYLKKWSAPKKRIYVVLGNHELWGFNSVKECTDAYQRLFSNLGIEFLNNCTRQISVSPGAQIIGGLGYAGYNESFNARDFIYRDTINREQEIICTQKWEDYYHKAVEAARRSNSLLFVLTHNPPYDWNKQKALDENCVYFYGHSHRNTLSYYEGTNTYVFADNQIGYENETVAFKKDSVFLRSNPFANYSDGVHEITPEDYLLFQRYKCIRIQGAKPIEKHVQNGSKFYLIKEKEYYGFFIVCDQKEKASQNGAYICFGGSIRKIGSCTDICYFANKFSLVINTILADFYPYRKAQEEISAAVKTFGGSGRIHGYIIDIDFFNHIMLNPTDGKLSFYYSEYYGSMILYDTLPDLLRHQCPPLLESYLKQNSEGIDKYYKRLEKSGSENNRVYVDIKNSPYHDSAVFNQIQRLFEAKVLRVWADIPDSTSRKALLEQ